MLGSIWPSSSNSSNTFSSQNLWLIFGCKLEVASNSSTGAVLETPNVVNLSQSSWFLIGRAQDVFQKTIYTRCQEHTLFQREVFWYYVIDSMVFFFILFSWFRSSDTNGWWLQVYQFWCHSLTSRIFSPIEYYQLITLKTQLISKIFFSIFSLFIHSKSFLDFYSGSLSSFGQRPPEAQNFSQSWADGLVSAPSLSAVGVVVTSR